MNKIIRVFVLSIFLYLIMPLANAAEIERVNVSSSGEQADQPSYHSSISANGRFVVFSSIASNLVADDTNGAEDIFVHDHATGVTERVNVSASGEQANGISWDPSISADGRVVAFSSLATNLVDNDTNSRSDVFVHDRPTGAIERVSISSTGVQGNSRSKFDNHWGKVSPLSADGRFVVFISGATNLAPGYVSGEEDLFIHDRLTNITKVIGLPDSVEYVNDGNIQNRRPVHFRGYSINSSGRYVAFSVGTFDTDAFDNDNQVFVYDRITETTKMISVNVSGEPGNYGSESPAMSEDGRFVVFHSHAENLLDNSGHGSVFIHDQVTGSLELISATSTGVQPDGQSFWSSISDNGRFVLFLSTAKNLLDNTTYIYRPIYIHDRRTGTTSLLNNSISSTSRARISGEGNFVVFSSESKTLVDGDTNGKRDIFVAENPLADSNSELISIDVRINGKTRETLADAAQLLTGTLYEVTYKITNNSPDRLTGIQVFEDGVLVCDVYTLDPGQTKQRSRCTARRTVLSGNQSVRSIVSGKVAGTPTLLTNNSDVYYTGIDNANGGLKLTHRINNINADTQSQAPTLNSTQASVSFKIENTSDIELYQVKTYHDQASPVNSGWDLQCFIGTLKPGQIRYCKRDITLSESGLNKAWGRVQGKSASVSPTGAINAANATYFIVP